MRVLLVCDDCVFVKILKEQPNFLVKIANKSFHTTAQNCITCWILIIPILQGKRLLPYIIAEKTSQRNKIAMFLFARVFGLFYYYFAVFRKDVFYGKVPFYWYLACLSVIKVRIVNIWLQCNTFVFFVRIIRYCWNCCSFLVFGIYSKLNIFSCEIHIF